jgi:hypothetical protein
MPDKSTHYPIVQQLHKEHPPAKTVKGALEFLLRVIAKFQEKFPDETVGLLIKTAGENIVPYGGTKVGASRLVYPKENLMVKILTDVPTTNGPSWQVDTDGIPDSGHHGGYLKVPADGTGPTDPIEPIPDEVTLGQLKHAFDGLVAIVVDLGRRVKDQEGLHEEVNRQLGTHNKQIAELFGKVDEQPAPPLDGHHHQILGMRTSGPKS